MRSHTDRNWFAESDIREARADRAERHGRTLEQAYELRLQAAKSAAICGECFRPLALTESVTMEASQVGGSRRANNERWLRVPVCLLCSLDSIKLHKMTRNSWGWYEHPRWHRCRCLSCGRPLRLYTSPYSARPSLPSLNAQTCCAGCARLAKNKRNAERRRVRHQPVSCIKCGRAFTPKRADGLTCSNRCRASPAPRTGARRAW